MPIRGLRSFKMLYATWARTTYVSVASQKSEGLSTTPRREPEISPSADMVTKGMGRTSNTAQTCAGLRVVSVVEVLSNVLNLGTVSDTDV